MKTLFGKLLVFMVLKMHLPIFVVYYFIITPWPVLIAGATKSELDIGGFTTVLMGLFKRGGKYSFFFWLSSMLYVQRYGHSQLPIGFGGFLQNKPCLICSGQADRKLGHNVT